jgi:hypothetical protein
MKFLGVPWGLRPRRTEQKLALSLLSMLPSAHVNRVGVRVVCFRGSMATPPILYLRFAGSLAVAAQDSRPSGSLLLSCKALSSSPSYRFIPAHKHRHYTQNPPRLGYQSVSDTWGLAKVVRKVEFKLLHHIRPQEIPHSSQTIPARWMQPAPTS